MNALVIGGTGQVGSLVVQELAHRGASARVLTTDPDKHTFLDGMTPVRGDLLDPASLRAALEGVQTMFLLNAVSPAEATQTLLALDIAREAEVEHVVYLSQIELDLLDCPHAAAKVSAEAMIRYFDIPATVLRPAYFIQNDLALEEPILAGAYPIPLGSIGAQMIDVRDLAEVAALAIVDGRAVGAEPVIDVVGPDVITGEGAAQIWSEVVRQPVAYGGDDLGRPFEERQSQNMPGWQAHDLVAMFRGCQRQGMLGGEGAVERMTTLLGRPLRSYRTFAEETFEQWQGRGITLGG